MGKLWLTTCSASVDSSAQVVLGTGDIEFRHHVRPGLPGLTFHEDQLKETRNKSAIAVRSSPHPELEVRLYGLIFRDDQMNETVNNS